MLLDAEIARIKSELGFNLLNIGAEPYIGITRYFEQVAIPNLNTASIATSSTTVTASDPTSGPSPVSLTLSSATGFAMFARVVVDVDDVSEMTTVRSVSVNTISVSLSLAHSGTYPVCVESGETLVRYYLARCRSMADKIDEAAETAGLKSADKGDVVFFGGPDERSRLVSLRSELTEYRSQLCSLLFGVGNISQLRMSGGGSGRIALGG